MPEPIPPYASHESLPYAARLPTPPVSGFAVTALVLGCVGCVPFVGVLAIVFAALALRRTKDGNVGGRGLALAGLILGIVGTLCFALGISILLPGIGRARESANRVNCASHLRDIGVGITLYANENRGANPPDFATLIADQSIPLEVMVCPSDQHAVATMPWSSDAAARAADNLDYIYTGEGTTSAITADEPIAFERLNDHQSGGNVLFGDGHVEFMQNASYMKLVNALVGTPRLDAEELGAITKP